MSTHPRSPSMRRRILAYAFCGALTAFSVQLLGDLLSDQSVSLHPSASSYVVCHAVPRVSTGTEKYFCSATGCYSDDDEDITVVGSYETEETCKGIAGSLQEGIKN